MANFTFNSKDCGLYIGGKLVGKGDELINIASELSFGRIPKQLLNRGLNEDDFFEIETLLTHEIFVKGNCLTPDEDFIGENYFDEDDYL